MQTKMLLFIIPIIGTLLLLILPFNTKEQIIRGKKLALFISILTFITSIKTWISLDQTLRAGSFQYIINFEKWIKILGPDSAGSEGQDFGLVLGIDGISIFYIVLTTFLIPVCILISWNSIKILERQFLICLLSLEVLLIGVFTILDILGFYILFEGVLIPMFIMIGVWGSREQKITAAYYFFFYTLVGSVLMLISIIYMYKLGGSTDYFTLLNLKIDPQIQNILFLGLMASLAVKIPMFPFHIWLPMAHVEAPVAGSVLLAGILIKLGSYGFIRFTLPILPDACLYFTPLIYTLSALAVIYASLTTLRQTDLKRIIAYSSVSHMGVVMLAIFTLSVTGIAGSIFLQIAHGIVSSALFIIVTMLYDRHHTRLVLYYRGMAITMPLFATGFLILTLANIAVPLTCNFIGEFLCLLATFESNPFIAVISSLGMVLSACYALFLYNRVCFGAATPYIAHNWDLTRREFLVLLPLIFLTIFLGLWPDIILEPIQASICTLFARS